MGKAVNQIIVRRRLQGWTATFVDDAQVIGIFGTPELMTAFTARATAEEVINALQRLNPDHIIILAGD